MIKMVGVDKALNEQNIPNTLNDQNDQNNLNEQRTNNGQWQMIKEKCFRKKQKYFGIEASVRDIIKSD